MLQYFFRGGIMMYPLLVISILIVAVIINRVFVFNRAETDEKRLMIRIKEFLDKKMPEGAIALCDRTSGPVAAILKAGLVEHAKGKKSMEEAFETAALYEIPRLEKFLPMLSTMGSVSTLIGFTGTVLGMINAFNSIAKANISSPAIVASGVAEALITTATGLIIAIPAIVFYHYFIHKVDKLVIDIERCSKELIDLAMKIDKQKNVVAKYRTSHEKRD